MTNTQALLDKAKQLCSPQSWYQLSKRTGIAHTTISRCVRRGGTLDNEGAERLADFLGMDALTIIRYMEEDRAKGEEQREFWRRKLPRLLPTVGFTIAFVVGGLTHTEEAKAEGIKAEFRLQDYTLCEILLRVARRLAGRVRSYCEGLTGCRPGLRSACTSTPSPWAVRT